jgi:hypothetical protein
MKNNRFLRIMAAIGIVIALYCVYSYIWLIVRLNYNDGIYTMRFLKYDSIISFGSSIVSTVSFYWKLSIAKKNKAKLLANAQR